MTQKEKKKLLRELKETNYFDRTFEVLNDIETNIFADGFSAKNIFNIMAPNVFTVFVRNYHDLK